MTPKKQFTGPKVLKVQQLSGLDDSIREFYDAFMAGVEPDLMSKNIAGLDAKYARESAEERRKRGLRYNHAYNMFIAAYSYSVAFWQADIDYYRKQETARAAAESEAKDRAAADDIQRSLA